MPPLLPVSDIGDQNKYLLYLEEIILNLKPIFEPNSLAVFGVSLNNESHPANAIFNKNRLHYPVKTYGINPSGGVLHEEKLYSRIADLPEKVDLAVIVVRSEHVPGVLKECIEAGVGGAVIASGGFAEVGRRDLEDNISAIAKEADFPIIGPNCIGVYSPSFISTFFTPMERMVKPIPGNIALVSQSGGILVDQIIKLHGEGTGISRAASIGNKTVLSEKDLIEYFINDKQTRVLTFYIEGFHKREGREFLEIASKCPKPVVVMKAGKSSSGMRAVSSHTASLAGDYRVFSEALAQYGIIEAKNEFELLNISEGLSKHSVPIKGNIAILTCSGGHGAAAADMCDSLGLNTPILPEELQEELRKKLSPSVQKIASLGNPFDLTGSLSDDDFLIAARYLWSRPEYDCLIILCLPYIPGLTMDLGAKLSVLAREVKKPLIAYAPRVEKYQILVEGFELNGVPVSHSVEGAVLMAQAIRRRAC